MDLNIIADLTSDPWRAFAAIAIIIALGSSARILSLGRSNSDKDNNNGSLKSQIQVLQFDVASIKEKLVDQRGDIDRIDNLTTEIRIEVGSMRRNRDR